MAPMSDVGRGIRSDQSGTVRQTGPMPDQTHDAAVTAEQPRRVRFVEPMPGFADDLDFTLSPIDHAGLLHSLRSVRDPGLRFVITPAGAFFADYRDSVGAALTTPMAGLLGEGRDGGEIELFLVLTVGAGLADTTANLRAPLVMEPDSGRAVQVILDDDALPMCHPLVAR